MASTLKCPFCGGTLLSDEKICPHCGGENAHYVEDTPRRIFHPKTIDELKEYCAERGMPLLRMRFFIGQDYREPKAFGIYKAGEKRYVVYKNKADGSRAVRYDGPDEAFAVNELFDKLLSECHNRGIYPDGNAQRSSGSPRNPASGSASRSGHTNTHSAPFVIGAFVLLLLINALSGFVRERNSINQKIEAFRQKPNTYDSVLIDKKYYTYDLSTRELAASDSANDNLNDGYYRESYYIYPSGDGIYVSSESDTGLKKTAEKGAVYYRNGKGTWYVYISSESDWKAAKEPDYSRLGKSLEYLGNVWQSTWNTPDYSSFPMVSGYYSHAEEFYYRDKYDSGGRWYAYQPADKDWSGSDSPLKLGIPAEDLKYLGTVFPDGISNFEESSPYAIQNKLTGYYRQGDQVYYQRRTKKPFTVKPLWYRDTEYEYYWYTYGQKPDPYVYADPASGEWYETSEPAADSLVYMGKVYISDWQEKWSVTDFEKSAVGIQVNNVNGYVKQEQDLFYHYKSSWYRFNPDNDKWESASEPSGDGLPEIYLGDSWQASVEANAADEWEDDWKTTDFKTSDTWKSIEQKEAAEAARIVREAKEAAEKRAEQERRDSWRDSYSSDYDSWDSDDTDWDSDW